MLSSGRQSLAPGLTPERLPTDSSHGQTTNTDRRTAAVLTYYVFTRTKRLGFIDSSADHPSISEERMEACATPEFFQCCDYVASMYLSSQPLWLRHCRVAANLLRPRDRTVTMTSVLLKIRRGTPSSNSRLLLSFCRETAPWDRCVVGEMDNTKKKGSQTNSGTKDVGSPVIVKKTKVFDE